VDKVLNTALGKAVATGLNVALIGEAGVGKGWTARLLHSRRRATNFYQYDCLTGEVERWGLVVTLANGLTKWLSTTPRLVETRFIKDIHYLDRRQVAFLMDHLHAKLLENRNTSSEILRAGLICSCEPERAKCSPWREIIMQFFPYEITIPPLRERMTDIPILVSKFISEWMRANHKVISGIEGEALAMLEGYDWPGNICELKSILGQACTLTENFGVISIDLIKKRIKLHSTVTTC